MVFLIIIEIRLCKKFHLRWLTVMLMRKRTKAYQQLKRILAVVALRLICQHD
jgi:hypothetical protein